MDVWAMRSWYENGKGLLDRGLGVGGWEGGKDGGGKAGMGMV